jgi:hypothetical protein
MDVQCSAWCNKLISPYTSEEHLLRCVPHAATDPGSTGTYRPERNACYPFQFVLRQGNTDPAYATNIYGRLEVYLNSFITSSLGGMNFTLRPFHPRRKRPQHPLNRIRSELTASLDAFGEKIDLCELPVIEPLFLGCSARSVGGVIMLFRLFGLYVVFRHTLIH